MKGKLIKTGSRVYLFCDVQYAFQVPSVKGQRHEFLLLVFHESSPKPPKIKFSTKFGTASWDTGTVLRDLGETDLKNRKSKDLVALSL